jgi:hypothetical protein
LPRIFADRVDKKNDLFLRIRAMRTDPRQNIFPIRWFQTSVSTVLVSFIHADDRKYSRIPFRERAGRVDGPDGARAVGHVGVFLSHGVEKRAE